LVPDCAERRAAFRDAHLTRAWAVFLATVLPVLDALPGFCGASVLLEKSPAGSQGGEVIVMTRWRSMDDVRGFAGDEPDRAVVEPAARAYLTWADARVSHYDVELENSK
jgi:heme-degrading monooxygenase HmoA